MEARSQKDRVEWKGKLNCVFDVQGWCFKSLRENVVRQRQEICKWVFVVSFSDCFVHCCCRCFWYVVWHFIWEGAVSHFSLYSHSVSEIQLPLHFSLDEKEERTFELGCEYLVEGMSLVLEATCCMVSMKRIDK